MIHFNTIYPVKSHNFYIRHLSKQNNQSNQVCTSDRRNVSYNLVKSYVLPSFKGKKVDMEDIQKQEKQKDEIVSSLLHFDYLSIINNLINTNEFSDTNTALLIRQQKDKKPHMVIAIPTPDSDNEPVYFDYPINSFIDVIQRLKTQKIEQHPKQSAQFESATSSLIDKLQNL